MATADPRRLQNGTFLVLFVGAMLLFWRTVEPIWAPVFLGMVIAISVNPLHARLVKRGWRPGLSAAALTAMVVVLSLAVIAFLGIVVGTRVVSLATEMSHRYHDRGAVGIVGKDVFNQATRLGIDANTIREHVGALAETIASSLGKFAAALLGGALWGVFIVMFTALTSYYLLVEGEKATRWFVDVLPLPDGQVWELARNFRDVTRAMLMGTGVTAVYQGVIAYIGYLIFQVPDALVWGALTGVASLLPGIGTALVWTPIFIVQLVTGHPWSGLGVLIWGSIPIVVVADYWLRPWLVGAKLRMNDLLVFIAIFGGIEAFGIMGLILGPLFAALFVALVRIYQREYRPRLFAAPAAPTTPPLTGKGLQTPGGDPGQPSAPPARALVPDELVDADRRRTPR